MAGRDLDLVGTLIGIVLYGLFVVIPVMLATYVVLSLASAVRDARRRRVLVAEGTVDQGET